MNKFAYLYKKLKIYIFFIHLSLSTQPDAAWSVYMESVTRAAVYVTKAGQVTAATSWHVTLGAAYMASATTEPVSACKAGTADTALSVSINDVFLCILCIFLCLNVFL